MNQKEMQQELIALLKGEKEEISSLMDTEGIREMVEVGRSFGFKTITTYQDGNALIWVSTDSQFFLITKIQRFFLDHCFVQVKKGSN